MEVKTLTIYEIQQKLKYAQDEIDRLKDENIRLRKKVEYYQGLLAIETDTDPLDQVKLGGVSNGEVLDGEH